MGTTNRSQPENFGRRIPTFGRGSTTGVVGGEGNRFPSLEISIDLSLFSFTSFVHRSLSLLITDTEERPGLLSFLLSGRVASPLSSVSWMSRLSRSPAWLLYCVSLSR